MNVPVIVPVYTLAPLATGVQIIAAGIDMLATLSIDARYIDKKIVILGDSAGGWISLRLILALTELASAEDGSSRNELDTVLPGAWDILQKHDLKTIRAIRDKVKAVILFSPAIDLEMANMSDRSVESLDPALRFPFVETVARLWTYGPNDFPGFVDRLPSGNTDPLTIATREFSLGHPFHSPANGVESLARYATNHKLKILAICGTHDILHPANKRLADKMGTLDLPCVDYEFHSVSRCEQSDERMSG